MKVLELLDEIVDIVGTSSSFPLTGKILIESEEILEIVKEIKLELPDEIEQAQWIKNERERIIKEAKHEAETILNDAKLQADSLVENNEITVKAKMRADDLMRVAENSARTLKMGSFEYVDSMLYNFQDKMEQINGIYFNDMFNNLQDTFEKINQTVQENRSEIKDMIYRAEMEDEK